MHCYDFQRVMTFRRLGKAGEINASIRIPRHLDQQEAAGAMCSTEQLLSMQLSPVISIHELCLGALLASQYAESGEWRYCLESSIALMCVSPLTQ